jgi:hypothetical protein
MKKSISTLGDIRQYAAIISFICWGIITIIAIFNSTMFHQLFFQFFLAPISAGIATFFAKLVQYREMAFRFNPGEKIEWTPIAYGILLLPIFLLIILLISLFLRVSLPLTWIPTFFLVNTGIQYAFFGAYRDNGNK